MLFNQLFLRGIRLFLREFDVFDPCLLVIRTTSSNGLLRGVFSYSMFPLLLFRFEFHSVASPLYSRVPCSIPGGTSRFSDHFSLIKRLYRF